MTVKEQGALDQALAASGAFPLSAAQRRGDADCFPLSRGQTRAVETWNAQRPHQTITVPQHLRRPSIREHVAARRPIRPVTGFWGLGSGRLFS